MKSRILIYAVRVTACAALATSLQLLADDLKICKSNPKIITFEAPNAAKGPGTSFCFLNCPGTVAENINEFGTVTGYYIDDNSVYHGFVRFANGAISDFDPPGAGTVPGSFQGTDPTSINTWGVIAGQYQDDNNIFHGFVRFPDGSFTTFEAPDAGTGAFQGTLGQIINQMGEVAGYYYDANNAFHGFLRSGHGAITEFEAPGAGTGAGQGTLVAGPFGSGLNSQGTVNGPYIDPSGIPHGYVRTLDGNVTTFDAPGAAGTEGGGINREGTIAGVYSDATGNNHSYLRTMDGSFTTFDAPGAGSGAGLGTFAVANNDFGVTAGYILDSSVGVHGFVRAPNGQIIVFNVPGTGTGSGQGTVPSAINVTGEISGIYIDGNNVTHGFVRGPDLCF